MACDSLDEFRDLAKYRKSFNGDLQIARSKAVKLVVLEAFKFEKDQKGLALVLGAVPTELMNQLKGNATKIKAAGALEFVDNVVKVTLKSGSLADGDVKKALDLAQVKREFKLVAAGAEREADETEDEALPADGADLPPRLKGAGDTFHAAQKELEDFFRERSAAMKWHEGEIKTQQDAVKKIAEIRSAIDGLNTRIAAASLQAKNLRKDLKDLAKDAQVARYSKAQLTKLQKAIDAQDALEPKLRHQIELQERKLPELELLERKHGASRHGAQTDMALQARRAATGGVTPDQKDNIHGVSEARVSSPEDGEEALTELKWRSTKVKIKGAPGQPPQLVNSTEVVKALLVELDKLDGVNTDTSSKFHSHELEREAVQRATALVEKECKWTEVQEGADWKPLDSVTVYVGPPASSAGWGFSGTRRHDPKMAVMEANKVIEKFRKGSITQEQLLDQLDVAMTTVQEVGRNGKTTSSVPMVKSARVTLGRTGKGWTSITHFPDSTATPPGWTLTGKTVRKDAKSQAQKVPPSSAP